MSDIDIRKAVQEELNNIAPEVDIASVNPAADLREAIDIDSMEFPEFRYRYPPSARHRYPRDRLSKGRHSRRGVRVYRRKNRIAN